MNIFKALIFGLVCLTPLFGNAGDCSCNHSYYHAHEDSEWFGRKVYIQPNQILISEDGIFVLDNEELVSISQLNHDENGMYIVRRPDKITDKCANGHKMWCGRCGGCVIRWCKFRCICVEWE